MEPSTPPVPLHFADLEIRILPREQGGYPVEMTSSGEREFPRGYLDAEILPFLPSASVRRDGQRLFNHLFHDAGLLEAWNEVRGVSPRRRLRLRLDEGAPELHALPWEALRDPGGPTAPARWLAADALCPFSRYLAGTWRPGRPVVERPVRLLAAIANPTDLEDYSLPSLDVAAERHGIEEAFAGAGGDRAAASAIEVTFLPPPVTLAALDAELRRGGYHILHLVAHGITHPRRQESALFLEAADGRSARISPEALAEMIGHQGESLRLIYLSSCQTARRSPADAFRGFAPRLVAAGVPAVLAMQDLVSVDTAQLFAAIFYERLTGHGQVDLAANEARAAVLSSGLPGAAIPVLFLRLRSGLLFERRGQVVGKGGDTFWQVLLESIADGECTPFLGPGTTTGLLPGPAELASTLATEHEYPFADHENLPRVAQYLGTIDQRLLRKKIVRHLTTGLLRNLGISPDTLDRRTNLTQAIASSDWLARRREVAETDIYQQLAELDLPLYITTNWDSLLPQALHERGREVRRVCLPWCKQRKASSNAYHDFEPAASSEEPVALHLFGTDEDLLSMVITEDDHLDFLARLAREHEVLLPTSVSESLASNTLLFLGYRLEDLSLKVILRGLLAHLDLAQWGRYHVAIQLGEAERRGASHRDVARYFQKYFGSSQIDVYWGSTHQFMNELHQRFRASGYGDGR